MKKLFVLVVFFLSVNLFAQPIVEWDKTLGGSSHQQLRKAIQIPDGSYMLGGWSSSGISGDKTEASRGGYDYWVVKLSNSGGMLWQKTIGGNAKDEFSAIEHTSDGGFILGGSSASDISGEKTETSRGGLDYWVVKIDSFGTIQWQSTIGGSGDDRLYSVSQTDDNGYILGGWSGSGLSGDKTDTAKGIFDFWIVKLDSSGNIQWQKTIGGSGSEVRSVDLNLVSTDTFGGMIIYQTPDGGYMLGGTSDSDISGDKTENSRGGFDFWVLKLDGFGDIQWQRTIGGDSLDYLYHMTPSFDNGCLIGGGSWSGVSGDKTGSSRGEADYWILKLDDSGNIQWQKTIGGSDDDVLSHINHTADSNYIISGWSRSNNFTGDKTSAYKGSNDFWILKLDASGNILWQKTVGGNSWDNTLSIEQTQDLGYFVAGTSQSGVSGDKTEPKRGIRDYWVVKLSPDTVQPDLVWPGDANSDGVANVYDILPIAVGYNATGPNRINASNNWMGQVATDWANTFSIVTNYKHADCDGNGIIDLFDVQPIGMNYGLTHPKSNAQREESSNPDLFFDFAVDSFLVGDTVRGSIQLGKMSNPIVDIYGIAFSIPYNSAYIDSNSFQIDFSNSWLASPDTSISLVKDLYGFSRVEMGLARIDHVNKTGYGKLADVSFVIQDNISGKDLEYFALSLGFDNIVAIDANENPLSISQASDTLVLIDNTVGIFTDFDNQTDFQLYPNPTNGQFHLSSGSADMDIVHVSDILGKTVYLNENVANTQLEIDLSGNENGIYIISVQTAENQVFNSKILLNR